MTTPGLDIIAKSELTDPFKKALLLEKEGELLKAVGMYEKFLKKTPSDLNILLRLMIVSRKLKKYRQEIFYINQAIKIHEQKYTFLKTKDLKVAALSKKINKLLGHTNKRGNNLLAIPEVVQLEKRKEVALKRMNN